MTSPVTCPPELSGRYPGAVPPVILTQLTVPLLLTPDTALPVPQDAGPEASPVSSGCTVVESTLSVTVPLVPPPVRPVPAVTPVIVPPPPPLPPALNMLAGPNRKTWFCAPAVELLVAQSQHLPASRRCADVVAVTGHSRTGLEQIPRRHRVIELACRVALHSNGGTAGGSHAARGYSNNSVRGCCACRGHHHRTL